MEILQGFLSSINDKIVKNFTKCEKTSQICEKVLDNDKNYGIITLLTDTDNQEH